MACHAAQGITRGHYWVDQGHLTPKRTIQNFRQGCLRESTKTAWTVRNKTPLKVGSEGYMEEHHGYYENRFHRICH